MRPQGLCSTSNFAFMASEAQLGIMAFSIAKSWALLGCAWFYNWSSSVSCIWTSSRSSTIVFMEHLCFGFLVAVNCILFNIETSLHIDVIEPVVQLYLLIQPHCTCYGPSLRWDSYHSSIMKLHIKLLETITL